MVLTFPDRLEDCFIEERRHDMDIESQMPPMLSHMGLERIESHQ